MQKEQETPSQETGSTQGPTDPNKRAGTQRLSQAQWRLVLRGFKNHKVAMFSLGVLMAMYFVGVLFPGFFAPYGKTQLLEFSHLPPQAPHFIDNEGHFHLRPFVYKWEKDSEGWENQYRLNKSERLPIHFFVKGKEYKLCGLFETRIHLFGTKGKEQMSLLGTDSLGRDMLSRILYAMRISLTIGFVGVILSLVIGLLLGGISGLMGGVVDDIIQRLIEILMGIPTLPLWMALTAAIPQAWSPITVFFLVTCLLSLIGWTGLARNVRSQFLSMREQDFVTAARGYNVPMTPIIFRHMIPNFMSFILVNLTLSIPGMILLSEQARRMKEMTRMMGKEIGDALPDEHTLVVNLSSPVVKNLLGMQDSGRAEDAKLLAEQVYDLALLSHRGFDRDKMEDFLERSNKILEMVGKRS